MSREKVCYSCKKFWNCKKPCQRVEESLSPANVIFHKVVTQHKYREFDALSGEKWEDKVYDLLFKLQWKEEWIAEAMSVSLKTVQRRKKMNVNYSLIKGILSKYNMHQYVLAEKIGISEERLSKILRGRIGVEESLLKKIAKALKVDPMILFKDECVAENGEKKEEGGSL